MKRFFKSLAPLFLFLGMFNFQAEAQISNTLSIPDLSAEKGDDIVIPVYLENTSSDITAVQFDIYVAPEALVLKTDEVILSDRSANHKYRVEHVSDWYYRFLLYSPDNSPLRGNSGVLFEIPAKVQETALASQTYQLIFSSVSISDKSGTNVFTGSNNGSFRLSESVDLVPSEIKVSKTNLMPNDSFIVSWTDTNQGGRATEQGWNDGIYLEDENGYKINLGYLYSDTENLAPGEKINQSKEVMIPSLPGMDGDLKIRVEIFPDIYTGENQAFQGNNSVSSELGMVNLGKILYFNNSWDSFTEGIDSDVYGAITRSGYRNNDETFALTKVAGDDRISVPETVTIGRNQTHTNLYLPIEDNSSYEKPTEFKIIAEGNGYEPAEWIFILNDNEVTDISLTPSKEEITEGESFELLIDLERESEDEIILEIATDKPHRFKFSSEVTVPAGVSHIAVPVSSIDNNEIELDQFAEFVVVSEHYTRGSCDVKIIDNDVPDIAMSLSVNEVAEDAGPAALVATISRTSNIDKNLILRLTDTSKNDIYYTNGQYTMGPGVTSIDIPLGINDNQQAEGDRTIDITAYIYASSCSCSSLGTGIGEVTCQLTIIDNDGPSLSLAASSSALLEGGNPVSFTVTRNTDTASPLTVNISSDNEEGLQYPHEVTITAGQESVVFEVAAAKNNVTDDDHIVTFNANASGFSKGICTVMVTDQSLPDARVSDISFEDSSVTAGDQIDISVTVFNSGYAPLPDATEVKIYRNGDSESKGVIYTSDKVPAGGSLKVSKTLSISDPIGSHSYYAVVNEKKRVKELSYTNNTSKGVSLTVVSPFKASASTEKKIYKSGEDVQITGQLDGKNIAGVDVEVYVINDGFRDKINVKSDANGKFSTSYTPAGNLSGHFSVGACYPDEGLKEELDYFEIYGLSLENVSSLTLKAYKGEEYSGYITLKNPGTLALTGVKASVKTAPEGLNVKLDCPEKIDGGQSVKLSFTFTPEKLSEGDDWENISINVETNEGVSVSKKLYYYCYNAEGALQPGIEKIKATVLKDSTREISFTVTNIGKGETGTITLALPSWMSSLTSKEIPSLKNGEEATISLKITPKADWQLNVPTTGSIGVNCSNGEGFSLPYTVEMVSENKGDLLVDVCDEYTYFTQEGPHVAGAQVTVTHPTTGAMITQGTTGQDGTFMVNLPEGWYKLKVTEDNHDSYTNNIYVEPGTITEEPVNLSISVVKVSYAVEETEVEDRYEIVTTYTYETEVPKAVVTVTQQGEVDGDNMSPGDSKLIYLLYTNHGLISAFDFGIGEIENVEGWDFKFLVDEIPDELPAKSTFILPVLVTLKADSQPLTRAAENLPPTPMSACMAGVTHWYTDRCGNVLRSNESAYLMALKMCATSALMGAVMDAMSSWGGSPNGISSTPDPLPKPDKDKKKNIEDDPKVIDKEPLICDPDAADCGKNIMDNLGGKIPGVGPIVSAVNGMLDEAGRYTRTRGYTGAQTLGMLGNGIKSLLPSGGDDNPIQGLAGDLGDLINGCWKFLNKQNNQNKTRSSDQNFNDNSMGAIIENYLEQIELIDKTLIEIFGDDIWWMFSPDELDVLNEAVQALNNPEILNATELMAYKPESMSKAQFVSFIERLNNDNPENAIDYNKLREYIDQANSLENKALEAGYESLAELCVESLEAAYNSLNDSSGSVCSKVKLQLTQTMVMTRQAFRGTLTIENGSAENPIKDLKLSLSIIRNDGEIATSHEFATTLESLSGFKGEETLDAAWELSAKSTGVATILFIPTRYAAPEQPIDYSFGGVLSYVDPYTGLEVTRELATSLLTVKPSPSLDMTYFMQRDIYGDDPFTEDKVEPSVPAEFALIINNTGYGDATNVNITTNQPKIVENEKGLMIDFELIGGAVNGKETVLAFGESVVSDFGTIPAQSSAFAQWWLQSSLLGHFSEYDVKLNHVSSYGNEDLSLVNEVSIHELIHGLTMEDSDETVVRGFLTNDIPDLEETPDRIYFSDGSSSEEVVNAAGFEMVKISDTEYRIFVAASSPGWNYGSAPDLTAGRRTLLSVVRESDGAQLPVDNFWLTYYKLADNKKPIYENLIHACVYAEANETYLLSFEPRGEYDLEIEEFIGVPDEDSVMENPLEKLTVKFNKPINESTFGPEDLSLYCQGERIDVSGVKILKEEEDLFSIDLKGVTDKSGYYELTVMTQGILDMEGFNGLYGRSVSWLQNVDENLKVDYVVDSGSFNIYPVPMKSVLFVSGNFENIIELSIFDMKGSKQISGSNIANGEAINVDSLSPGIYIIKAETNRGVFIKKALKK